MCTPETEEMRKSSLLHHLQVKLLKQGSRKAFERRKYCILLQLLHETERISKIKHLLCVLLQIFTYKSSSSEVPKHDKTICQTPFLHFCGKEGSKTEKYNAIWQWKLGFRVDPLSLARKVNTLYLHRFCLSLQVWAMADGHRAHFRCFLATNIKFVG